MILEAMLYDGVHLSPNPGNDAAGEALWKTFQQIGLRCKTAAMSGNDELMICSDQRSRDLGRLGGDLDTP